MLTVAVDGVIGARPPPLVEESVTVNDSVDSVLESSRIETEICFVAPLLAPSLNITMEPATLSKSTLFIDTAVPSCVEKLIKEKITFLI